MDEVEIAKASARHVRHELHPRSGGHARDARAADVAAVVMHVRLDDVTGAVLNAPLDAPNAEFLLAKGDGDCELVGHLLGFPYFVKGHGLFIEAVLVLFHHAANADGVGNVVGAVGVSIKGEVVAEGFANERDERFGSTGKRIDVTTHASAEAELERAATGIRDELLQMLDFLFGLVPAHTAGDVDGDIASDRAAKEISQRALRSLAHQ